MPGKQPPPLPPDALSAPSQAQRDAMPSPFDEEVISSAPAPTPARGQINAALWMDRPHYPLVRPEHRDELEQDAAINEFSGRMPRHEAEAKAYADYKAKQHKAAAAHHLAGMRAADAVGDKEAARKHSFMYERHSKAIGHEPIGPAHPDVQAALGAAPPKVYRYKAHPGDLLSLAPHVTEQGVISSAPAPELGKAEADALRALYAALEPLAKGDREFRPISGDKQCTAKTGNGLKGCQSKAKFARGFNRYCLAHAKKYGYKEPEAKEDPMAKGDVVGRIGNPAGAAPQPVGMPRESYTDLDRARDRVEARQQYSPTADLLARHVGNRSLDDDDDREAVRQHLVQYHGLHPATATYLVDRHNHLALDDEADRMVFAGAIERAKNPELDKKEKTPEEKSIKAKLRTRLAEETKCPDCGGYKPHWAHKCLDCYKKDRGGLGKAEKMIHDGGVCRCEGYKFPHRRGSGKCPHKK